MTLKDQHAQTTPPGQQSTEEPSFIDRASGYLSHLYDEVMGTPEPAAAKGLQRSGSYTGQLGDGGGAFTLRFRQAGTQLFGSYVAPSGNRYQLKGQALGPDGFSFTTTATPVHIEIKGTFEGDHMTGTLVNPKHRYSSAFQAQARTPQAAARPASAAGGPAAPSTTKKPVARRSGPAGKVASAPAVGTPSPEQAAAIAEKYPDAAFTVNRSASGTASKAERHRVFGVIVAAARDLGEPFPEVLAAQWALESTWGKAPSGKNNLFGIKARKGEASTQVMTHEQDGKGHAHAEKAAFRDYDSVIEGVQARVNLTRSNPSYAKHGYFQATTCREAIQALKDGGYATDKKYVDKLVNFLRGVGMDADRVVHTPADSDRKVATAKPPTAGAPGGTPARPVAANASPTGVAAIPALPPAKAAGQGEQTGAAVPGVPREAAQPEVTPAPDTSAEATAAMEKAPTELAPLMAKTELTPEEIKVARALIEAVPAKSEREELFLDLQRKVPYHNQRNNATQEDGTAIGDKMCNLTSLAMALETLGISNPEPEHFTQFEDYLESLRVHRKLPARTDMSGWGGVAKAMGATLQIVGGDVQKGESGKYEQSWWGTHVLPALKQGKAVTMSIGGHIVRVQEVAEDGLVVDDPYGISQLKPGKARGWRGTNAKPKAGAAEASEREGAVGSDVKWSWAEVSGHVMHWVAVLSK